MIKIVEITECPLSPEKVIAKVRSNDCGCVVAYIGLIRDCSAEKQDLSVEYRTPHEEDQVLLYTIAEEAAQQWPISHIAISHRIGKLGVGEIDLIVAVASAQGGTGFDACQYVADQFKRRLPTQDKENHEESGAIGPV